MEVKEEDEKKEEQEEEEEEECLFEADNLRGKKQTVSVSAN